MSQQVQTNNEQQFEQEFEQKVEAFGKEAASRAKELLEQGNVRRLIIRKADGNVLIEVPLVPALVVATVLLFWMPFLTLLIVGTVVAAKISIEVVNTEESDDAATTIEVTS